MQRLSAGQNQQVAPSAAPAWLTAKASELGFDLCGVIPAAELAPPEHFAEWLESGFAGEMRYLHDPRRSDPAAILPEARSVIVCAVNYNPAAGYSTEAAARAALYDQPRGWISRYAWGDDYHLIVGDRLEKLVAALRERFGAPFGESFAARAYVDTGPVSERMAAKLAGLGWLGKNTCLIHRELGSWLFLGVILTSLDLHAGDAAREPAPDLCGNCRLCIDACPTGALVEPYVLDARRCISYLTIELRGSIPEDLRAGMGWQVFGCDICQDVCPWNRAAPPSSLPGLAPRREDSAPQAPEAGEKAGLEAPELLRLLSLSEQGFRETFRQSAVRRAKWRGLVRNACVAAGNFLRQTGASPGESSPHASPRVQARAELKSRLAHWVASDDALIAEHARWALAQDEPAAPAPPGGAARREAAPASPGLCPSTEEDRIAASPGRPPTSKKTAASSTKPAQAAQD